MPAKHLNRTHEEQTFSHIYNCAIENRNLFNDKEDHEVFLGFLKDYLSNPDKSESIKKTFNVRGRVFRGVPHRPKNYYNKIELIAYNLMPDHFHLVVHQITKGSLEKLIRSLCTRYVIYYNKKYKRTGSLFAGPYKSIRVEKGLELLQLTRYLHLEFSNGYSSYEDYLGVKTNSWVKPDSVLAYFKEHKNDLATKAGSYKDFVDHYTLKPDEQKMLERIVLEKMPATVSVNHPQAKKSESFKDILSTPSTKPRNKFPAFVTSATLGFVLLFFIGYSNVSSSPDKYSKTISFSFSRPNEKQAANNPEPDDSLSSPTPQVSGLETENVQTEALIDPEPSAIPEGTSKEVKILTITIGDRAQSVNIRKEPSTSSAIIGKAMEGEIYEYVSLDNNWYQIKLNNAPDAFISAMYAEIAKEIEGEDNQL